MELFGYPVKTVTVPLTSSDKEVQAISFGNWFRFKMERSIATLLKSLGISFIDCEELLDCGQLAMLAEVFARSEKVLSAVACLKAGNVREGAKQFLVKYGERNDLLLSQFEKLQPIIDKACGEGMQPYHCDMWYVIPSDRPREWSQNWHRDRDGSTVVKVFCYFTDVTEESGPLEYVVGSHAGKHSDIVTLERSYATAEEAERIMPEDVATLTVPAGTLAFVNTTGLHRGGYAKGQPRLCAVWTFVRKQR